MSKNKSKPKSSAKIDSKAGYNSIMFPDKIPSPGTEDEIFKERLKVILDTRKFEIDLYWKRATYFWTFIAATLTGYGLTLSVDKAKVDIGNVNKFQFLIICLGIVFSLSWFLVNKGRKFWQENWEAHLNLTEDNVIGPLFKTTIRRNDS